ncbi:MAG: hypothetical protein Q8Q54_11415 [Methylococcales bacterium]|nr:hypothetical protein [Methylococcales bacterium]MDP3839519.1 hypothetical protein [Methylococcales bacterium]
MNILWIEDFGGLQAGKNILNQMFGNLLSFDAWDNDLFSLKTKPSDLNEFCTQQKSLHTIYLCRNYFDYEEFKENHAILNEIDAIIIDVRLDNGEHVDLDKDIPEYYTDKRKFHENGGFYIFNDLIHLGIPAEIMCFMTAETSTVKGFENKCTEIYMPKVTVFEKIDADYIKLRDWLTAQQSSYAILRRGIIEACHSLKNFINAENKLLFNSFIEESEKKISLEDSHNYLDVLANFLPLREPVDKSTLYKLFIRTLTHEWEATEPKKIRGLAWIMKSTRNWITHNSTVFNAVDEQIIAYLFMINMRIMFNFYEVKKTYEEILFKLFSGENLTKETFENQNKNKLIALDIKKAYCNLQNKVASEKIIKDAFRFPALANNIQESNSELRKDKVLLDKLLYQMFWLINSYPRVDVRMGKVEITFEEFDYRKKAPYLFELARHIYSRSFS